MRSSLRVALCGAAFALAFVFARADFVELHLKAAPALAQFGGAVLVGDGEVFAGESANQFRSGLVYVYRKTGNTWVEAAQLTGPNSAVSDGFGTSLAIDGSNLYVGAGSTAVHVFTKRESVWTFAMTVAATLVPEQPAAAPATPATPPAAGAAPAAPPAPTAARFGNAIAAASDWLLIGKELAGGGRGRAGRRWRRRRRRGGGPAPAQPAGAVFVFKRGADRQFAYHSTIASADAATAAGDRFGSAIAISGATALIGASGHANGAGLVHEFSIDTDFTWKSTRTFAPIGVQGNESFGSVVAVTGDQAVVAAPGDAGGYGAVYVFRKVTQAGGRGRGAGGAPAPQAAAGAAPHRTSSRPSSTSPGRKSRVSPRPRADEPIALPRLWPPTTVRSGSARRAPVDPAACSCSRAAPPDSRSTA